MLIILGKILQLNILKILRSKFSLAKVVLFILIKKMVHFGELYRLISFHHFIYKNKINFTDFKSSFSNLGTIQLKLKQINEIGPDIKVIAVPTYQ